MINIINYADEHQPIFKSLNLEWLDQYNLTESHDLDILDNPRKMILDTGGVIYLAEVDGKIIGSAALIYEHDKVYELAKMSVDKVYRGSGISKMLIEKCIDAARELKAEKIILFSNHQLKTALSLYEKYNFRHVPVVDSHFTTADVKMELELNQ